MVTFADELLHQLLFPPTPVFLRVQPPASRRHIPTLPASEPPGCGARLPSLPMEELFAADFRSRRGLPKQLRTLSAAPFPLSPLHTPGLSPSDLSRACRDARSPTPGSRRSPLPRAPENKRGAPAALPKAKPGRGREPEEVSE